MTAFPDYPILFEVMDIPTHYLQARTKAGRAEIERREDTRHKAIMELKHINSALEFVELAEDLNVNQTKLTVAKQRVMLDTIIEKLQDAQLTTVNWNEDPVSGTSAKAGPMQTWKES